MNFTLIYVVSFMEIIDNCVNYTYIFVSAEIDERMNEHLGCMGVSMDGRFASIRAMETNLGEYCVKQ